MSFTSFKVHNNKRIPRLSQGDVCNSRLVNHIFNTENIDVIFHLAAKTHVGEQQLFRLKWRSYTVQPSKPSLCFSFSPQSRPLNPRPVSSGSTSTGPELYWQLPIRLDTSRSASSTSAPMRCTEPVWRRSAGPLLFSDPADGLLNGRFSSALWITLWLLLFRCLMRAVRWGPPTRMLPRKQLQSI